MDKNELIMHLIMEELRNKRLIYSLEDMGFDCSMYTMNISTTIIQLAGYELDDDLLEWYHELIDNALKEMDIWNMHEKIRKSAAWIFMQMEEKKQALKLAGLAKI